MRTVTFFAGIVLLSACTKKPSTPTPNPTPNPVPPTNKCMITGMIITEECSNLFDFDINNITFYYDSTYIDSANHIDTKMTYKYTYHNGMIANIREYENAQLKQTINIIYNGAKKPYVVSFHTPNGIKTNSYEFQYNANGEISSRTSKSTVGNHTMNYYYTSGLLTKVDYRDIYGNYSFYTYTYTTQDNKLIIDNSSVSYLLNINGEKEAMTLCDGLLNNNKLIASLNVNGGIYYNFTYQLNTKGYPEKVFCNGNVIMENKFHCN